MIKNSMIKEKDLHDRHLNLFIPYGLSKMNDSFLDNELIGRQLIFENNLSRVIARFLMESSSAYRKFQKDFLELIDENGEIKNVFFQKSNDYIKSYYFDKKNISKFKAVTLTDVSLDNNIIYESIDNSKFISDIVLEVNDCLVFIEVKRNNVDATNQVINQIENYSGCRFYDDVKKIFWNDITTILLNLSDRDIVIGDYVDFLKRFFPNWFVYKMTDVIKSEDYKYEIFDIDNISDSINVRLFNLFLRFYNNNDNNVSYRHLRTRRALEIKSEFASEMQIRFNKENNNIGVHLWTGETLYNMRKFEMFIKNNYDKFLNFKNYKDDNFVTCLAKPYILFRDSYKYLYSVDLSNFDNDIVTKDFISLITGKMLFKDFCIKVRNNISLIQKHVPDILEILSLLEENYYSKGRTVVIISVGYELIINYPYKYYSLLEKKTDFSLGKDGLDEVVKSSLQIYDKYFYIKLKRGV